MAGTVDIAFVATLPRMQGRGYAEAAMRQAIAGRQELTGFPRVTLHATNAGRPLYEAMGFAMSAHFQLLRAAH